MDKKDIFQNINFWLQYAEAKNGALLTINGALIFSTLSLFDDFKTLPFFKYTLALFLICIAISLIINFWSFFPNSNVDTLKKKKNLLFWGTIAKYDTTEDYSSFMEKEMNDIDSHIEEEILINSKITRTKYLRFIYALRLTISGLIIFSVYSIFIIVTKLFTS